MNRLIIKYAYPITAIILVIFAWVIYSRAAQGWNNVLVLAVAAVIVWAIGAPTFLYLWPRITISGFKRAILKRGFGTGPIPVNTLYAEPSTSSASPTGSLMGTGTDDVLYVAGWLDLRNGPQVLHVPDTAGRYYSLQFTDPSTSANFAYVGKRVTGTGAGDYLLSAPGWNGTVPEGLTQISAPHNSALIIGRVFVDGESDQPTAYALATQITLAPVNPSGRSLGQ
ncbi:DUF1254 domain-containing protein [Diaminobutyricibacter sp. McL0608]|uniref:DUF1254 domain-containing protein n=1 Tax=Leifsonia sp. McL0608 TaxID=3143537 RepID=UPI0031F31B12